MLCTELGLLIVKLSRAEQSRAAACKINIVAKYVLGINVYCAPQGRWAGGGERGAAVAVIVLGVGACPQGRER